MALSVQSVQALWFFTSDLVFVLLFPQLVYALFDRKANLAGSLDGVRRVASCCGWAGESRSSAWRRSSAIRRLRPRCCRSIRRAGTTRAGALLFPYKTLAALAGMVLLPVVSRLTARWIAAAAAAKRGGIDTERPQP